MKHIKPASVILLGLVSLTAACQQKPAEAPKTAATMTEDQKAIYAYGAAIGQQLAEQTRPLRRALAQAEQRMEQLGAERSALEQRLSSPLPAGDIADAGRRLKALAEELQTQEDEWLRLSGEIEAIEQGAAAT